jgi:hypothetical protein
MGQASNRAYSQVHRTGLGASNVRVNIKKKEGEYVGKKFLEKANERLIKRKNLNSKPPKKQTTL